MFFCCALFASDRKSSTLLKYSSLGESLNCPSLFIVFTMVGLNVSIAVKGELFYNLTLDEVKMILLEELRPKQSILLEDETVEEEEANEEVI